MGQLDEHSFQERLGPCPGCGGAVFEVASYLDRKVSIMLAEANGEGTWAHDGEKFIDGVYRIACAGCRREVFASDDCPRCHAKGTLPATLAAESHLAVPKRCPGCNELEMTLIGFAPAVARAGAGPVRPVAKALFGEPGFHVIAVACDTCDWATAAPGCPLCLAPGPLRKRP